MNKPAAVLFQHDMNPAERDKLMNVARIQILSLPGITPEGLVRLDVNMERTSICIRFMSTFPRVDTQNAEVLAARLQESSVKCSEPSHGMIHMDLGDFLVTLANVVVEKIGTRCADTGACHHDCTTECFRKTCCEPLTISGLGSNWQPLEPKRAADVILHDDRTATYVDNDEVKLHNGIYNVKNRVVKYRGFEIKPKLDFGQYPYHSHGNITSTGWIVVKDGCLALPAAGWNSSILEARASIDIWIESGFNAEKYWELMEPYRY
jgi:hypothetical protein